MVMSPEAAPVPADTADEQHGTRVPSSPCGRRRDRPLRPGVRRYPSAWKRFQSEHCDADG